MKKTEKKNEGIAKKFRNLWKRREKVMDKETRKVKKKELDKINREEEKGKKWEYMRKWSG